MPLRAYAMLIVFAVTAGSAVLASTGPAQALRCEAQINKALEAAAIPQSEVTSIRVMRRPGGAKSATNYTYDAWIRLNSCSGYVMVGMTRMCVVQQTYTSGDCKQAGMPSY